MCKQTPLVQNGGPRRPFDSRRSEHSQTTNGHALVHTFAVPSELAVSSASSSRDQLSEGGRATQECHTRGRRKACQAHFEERRAAVWFVWQRAAAGSSTAACAWMLKSLLESVVTKALCALAAERLYECHKTKASYAGCYVLA
eukprot:360277-Chlamydomonas_euryale.AAC.2